MSDLSWLNPTPHTIAVYASRPLSPATTQHSLPSGRYALLGPDFHRLDRTSLRLAHSFDHLVGEREQRGWNGEASGGERCLAGSQVLGVACCCLAYHVTQTCYNLIRKLPEGDAELLGS